ncbi:LA2681 family HEPN domain-containing protein [Gallaecimonas mangrovi]|uniref:LA2681 family HEPN domain-containing protein n=1 Tax=Gallaecimonas mangrovi TaxID=2291597 RepID=UPI000E207C41|nr:LA2681 family HEPN domain-containing protein [Gallaecimonas mangrovi]
MSSELDLLGIEIDSATENNNVSDLTTLLEKCDSMIESEDSHLRPIILFYRANIYSSLAALKSYDPEYAWSWQQSENVLEILNLRRAISDSKFPSLNPIFQCKVYTNLGNSLNQFGRFIEAIKAWDSALNIMPNFAMALGNKGIGLTHYARALYDYGHGNVMVAHAVDELKGAISKDALWDSGLHPEAKEYFRENYLSAEKHLERIEYRFDFDLNQWPVGDSKKEVGYRSWCLDNNLFLSPLNDVTKLSVSAQDVLHLPSHTYNIDEEARFPNYFNIMKQEYVTARFMLFESLDYYSEHISDKDVLLMDGFDGARFSYRIEQLKIAFRLAYSIFDKVALFLNDYYSVGLEISSVNFRKIWGKRKNKNFELNSCFEGSQNWPLRGLYFLSKDLFDDDFDDVALPESKELAGLRNRIEHRYLSLQTYEASVSNTDIHSYISLNDFQLKTLRIMSMAREALIYLSLAMHREEKIRNIENEKVSVPIQSSPIERFYK